jgi:hypothetical protein
MATFRNNPQGFLIFGVDDILHHEIPEQWTKGDARDLDPRE